MTREKTISFILLSVVFISFISLSKNYALNPAIFLVKPQKLFHLVTWEIFQPEELYSEDEEKSRVEKFADAFASVLLLPVQEVREEFENRKKDNKISYFDCIEIAREFGVSIDALLWRLVNLIKRKEAEKVLENYDLDENEDYRFELTTP